MKPVFWLVKFNRLISDNRKAMLSKPEHDTGKLWALLKKTNNWGIKIAKITNFYDLDKINKSFAAIATVRIIVKML